MVDIASANQLLVGPRAALLGSAERNQLFTWWWQCLTYEFHCPLINHFLAAIPLLVIGLKPNAYLFAATGATRLPLNLRP